MKLSKKMILVPENEYVKYMQWMRSKQQKMEQELYSGNEKPPVLEKISSVPATSEEKGFVPVHTQATSMVDSANQVDLSTVEPSVTRKAEYLPIRGNISVVTETKKPIKCPAGPPGIRRISEDKKKKKNKVKKRLKGIQQTGKDYLLDGYHFNRLF